MKPVRWNGITSYQIGLFCTTGKFVRPFQRSAQRGELQRYASMLRLQSNPALHSRAFASFRLALGLSLANIARASLRLSKFASSAP